MIVTNETNCTHKLLSTDRNALRLFMAFVNNWLAKYRIIKNATIQNNISRAFLCRINSSSISSRYGLLKKVFGSATYGSETTALIISNKEMKQIMKIVKLLEDCGLLIKGVTQTIENKTKKKE